MSDSTQSTQSAVAVYANALADILMILGDKDVDDAQARAATKRIVLEAVKATTEPGPQLAQR